MEIDITTKTKIQNYLTKHFKVDGVFLITDNEIKIDSQTLYYELINTFGFDVDITYLSLIEWLIINGLPRIQENWTAREYYPSAPNSYRLPGVYVVESSYSTVCLSGYSGSHSVTMGQNNHAEGFQTSATGYCITTGTTSTYVGNANEFHSIYGRALALTGHAGDRVT